MTSDQLVGLVTTNVAIAEGYFVRGDIPWTQRNPGDLTLGNLGHQTPDGKYTYDLHSQGWTDLEGMWHRILSGTHPWYPTTMTWDDVAKKYTGEENFHAWAVNVCSGLKVPTSQTLAEFLAANLT
jgi:hypothetical protein